MKMTLELWQALVLGTSLVSAFFVILKMLLIQFSQRIQTRMDALVDESKGWRHVERDLMQLRAELPERYVRREDYVRNQTIIEGKLDLIGSKIELMQIKVGGP
ncbi:MAG: hypothetical protein JSS41_04720 [Proteobacteria bacterium]|nr:hypothetical protein [Pseudomonadota bacterium]MBS0464671.1 hypothetical protein [Pseudomonadota bacterium]